MVQLGLLQDVTLYLHIVVNVSINTYIEGPEGGGPNPISHLKFWQNPSTSWIFIRNPSPSY